jgi:hypothetical protein
MIATRHDGLLGLTEITVYNYSLDKVAFLTYGSELISTDTP